MRRKRLELNGASAKCGRSSKLNQLNSFSALKKYKSYSKSNNKVQLNTKIFSRGLFSVLSKASRKRLKQNEHKNFLVTKE